MSNINQQLRKYIFYELDSNSDIHELPKCLSTAVDALLAKCQIYVCPTILQIKSTDSSRMYPSTLSL